MAIRTCPAGIPIIFYSAGKQFDQQYPHPPKYIHYDRTVCEHATSFRIELHGSLSETGVRALMAALFPEASDPADPYWEYGLDAYTEYNSEQPDPEHPDPEEP